MSDEPYDGPGNPEDLPLYRDNDVFHLLSQHRKRAVILTLAMAPWGRVHLRQLAEVLALLEADAEGNTVSTRQVTNTRTNLKRSHLPALLEAGIIEWESSAQELLVPGPGFDGALQTLRVGSYSLAHEPTESSVTHD
ncbi:DUF7344 domain-containing protein [Halobellus rufus]|uniref:DUF7344 domain-containing protein n=1 Tax=Halobellus rufus TaxID=1448860 RepID=UPI000678C6E8|nr:hypothetical protein [Halobellus rufus]